MRLLTRVGARGRQGEVLSVVEEGGENKSPFQTGEGA
jgi:hypothetical protein